MTPIAAPPIEATVNRESEPAADKQGPLALSADPTLVVVRVPVDARGLALGILATIAVVFALEWAQRFVISLLLGILFAYTLNPLVVWLERIKIPRVLGSIIVMAAVVCALALGTYSLRGQVQTIAAQLGSALRRGMNEVLARRGVSGCVYGELSMFHIYLGACAQKDGCDHMMCTNDPSALKAARSGPRAEGLRATLAMGPDGPVATALPNQDSSLMAPLSAADCLVIREPHAPAASSGSPCVILKLGL